MAAQTRDTTRTEERPAPKEGADTGLPGGGVGRKDVTGVAPPGTHADPDLTEGHPGYQESGGSEIIPNDRLTGGSAGR